MASNQSSTRYQENPMSNIKSVNLSGKAPFDLYQDEKLASQLAFLNSPCSGLRISYSPAPADYLPNSHGGRTARYSFTLQGQEAVSIGWLETFVHHLEEQGGEINQGSIYDIEANERVFIRFRPPIKVSE
jgi:hypothetical protein